MPDQTTDAVLDRDAKTTPYPYQYTSLRQTTAANAENCLDLTTKAVLDHILDAGYGDVKTVAFQLWPIIESVHDARNRRQAFLYVMVNYQPVIDVRDDLPLTDEDKVNMQQAMYNLAIFNQRLAGPQNDTGWLVGCLFEFVASTSGEAPWKLLAILERSNFVPFVQYVDPGFPPDDISLLEHGLANELREARAIVMGHSDPYFKAATILAQIQDLELHEQVIVLANALKQATDIGAQREFIKIERPADTTNLADTSQAAGSAKTYCKCGRPDCPANKLGQAVAEGKLFESANGLPPDIRSLLTRLISDLQ